jgi:hypothetical protein
MIEFQLDETSDVATYLQLVQQVRQVTRGLGQRYWRAWAPRDCSLAIPGGQVTGLGVVS